MLEFLVRLFSVMTAAVFMLAMCFGLLTEFLGIDLSDKLSVTASKSGIQARVEKKIEKENLDPNSLTLASDLTASLYQLDKKVDMVQEEEVAIDKVQEVIDLEIKSIEDLEDILDYGEVMVLLNNAVLDSFLYEEKAQVLTKVLKVHSDYVETTKGGMSFKGGSIYTHEDFMEAFKAAGSNFELLDS